MATVNRRRADSRQIHGEFLRRERARRFSGCGGNYTAETLRTESADKSTAVSAVLSASAVDLVPFAWIHRTF
jgi:hypothetical protein